MKNRNRLVPFLMGVIAALILSTLSMSALAASGSLTITADPINVLVNGEVFKPKDAKGNDVLVFVYNGTTYAPLRALAEAYGLEVGYDAKSNTATVTDPDKANQTPAPAVSSFASQWTVTEKPVTNYGSERIFDADYSGSMSKAEFMAWWKSMTPSSIKADAEKMAAEAQTLVPGYEVTVYFTYGGLQLGESYATAGGFAGSNFVPASIWIK